MTGVTPVEGGLYITCSKRPYGVFKVLKADDEVVHIRLYKNTFEKIPARIDPATLALGSINDPDGFGIGHLPISNETFNAWQPQLLQHTVVDLDELEGYEAWRESNGGVWG